MIIRLMTRNAGLFVTSMGVMLLLLARTLSGAEPIFHLPFETNVQPAKAGGDAAPRLEGEITYRSAASGMGGAFSAKTRLSFPAPGNVAAQQGTLIVWVYPDGAWCSGGGNTFVYIDGLLTVGYDQSQQVFAGFLPSEKEPRGAYILQTDGLWVDSNPRCIAIRWQRLEGDKKIACSLFVNGKPVSTNAWETATPLSPEGRIWLAGSPASFCRNPLTLDGVRIFGEALSDEQIRRAYDAEAKDLKLAPVTPHEFMKVKSSLDGTEQPSLLFIPPAIAEGKPLPLLVVLHTWSFGYLQEISAQTVATKRGWLVLLPHFRGPNKRNPEACGSLYAQHDIIDAVSAVQSKYQVDKHRIYVVGASGGGMMTMLMVCKYPDLWAAAVEICGISDLLVWYQECNGRGYGLNIAQCAGGAPGTNAAVDWEYLRRSPITFAANAAPVPIKLMHGDKDRVVPHHHSSDFNSKVLAAGGKLAELTIGNFYHAGSALGQEDWLAVQVKAEKPPAHLDLVTDEAKWYWYVHLTPATSMELGRCKVTVAERRVTLQTKGLSAIVFSLGRMGITGGEAVDIEIEKDAKPLQLSVDNVAGDNVLVGTNGVVPKQTREGAMLKILLETETEKWSAHIRAPYKSE